MLKWKARITSTDALDALLADEAGPEDTHPSLRERIATLEQGVRMPPPVVCSAGEEILGVTLEQLAAQLDQGWLMRHGESWTRHRAGYLERRATLDRLAALETPTAEELFKWADVLELLEGPDEALPIYLRAGEQGHPGANLAAGRVLLGRMQSRGIALVEASMDRDDSLVPEGCRILAQFYKETNQALAAQKCEWRATRHTTRARLAQQG